MAERAPVRGLLPRILIVASLWTLLNAYVGARLFALATVPGAVRAAGWVGIVLLAAAPFVAFTASRAPRRRFTAALVWAGFTGMGLASVLIVLFAVRDLVRAPVPGAAVLALAVAITLVGLPLSRRPRLVKVAVPIRDLPTDLAGFRIVQLSDLHVSHTLGRDFVEAVVATANGLAPDLVVVAGDAADGFVRDLGPAVAPLGALRAPHGTYFVTGNHEYYWDPNGWARELERLGIATLDNAHRLIRRGEGRLLLAGVPDLMTDRASSPAAALAGAPESDVRVLLAHQPRSAYAARDAGFHLQLSGHTHGGQYFPFNLLVRLFQPFVAGLHRLGEMWLYVSRGTGYWGPPIRFGAPSEVTLIELARA